MSYKQLNIVLILKDLIDKKNIKLIRIADKLNVTSPYIYKVFKEGKMNTELLEKIMEITEISYSDLIHPEMSQAQKIELLREIKNDVVNSLDALEKKITGTESA